MSGEGGRVESADSTPLFIGAVAALATVAIGIGLVVVASTSGSDSVTASRADVSAAAAPTSTTTSTTSTTTTTTTAPTFFGVAPGSGTAAPPPAAPPATDLEPGEVPGRATSDPEEDPVVPLPNPEGISTTLDSCTWSPVNGGELAATGTVTASPAIEDDTWYVTVYWLQNDRWLDEEWVQYELFPGESRAWRLVVGAPLPPADPFRCVVEVE